MAIKDSTLYVARVLIVTTGVALFGVWLAVAPTEPFTRLYCVDAASNLAFSSGPEIKQVVVRPTFYELQTKDGEVVVIPHTVTLACQLSTAQEVVQQ